MLNHRILLATSSIGMGYLGYRYYGSSSWKRISTQQLQQFKDPETGIYVSYRQEVFDITDFVKNHPGGQDQIMKAAGGPIDHYWKLYRQHTNDPSIYRDILLPMKVAELSDYRKSQNLPPDDNNTKHKPSHSSNDVFGSKELNEKNLSKKVISQQPLLAEARTEKILQHWITPLQNWFVRNHHPIPEIDPEDYILETENQLSSVPVSKKVSLNDLIDQFDSHEIISSIQCAGNRRSELNNIRSTSGTLWSSTAISTAKWKGVWLRDLLMNLKVDSRDYSGTHVCFETVDGVKSSIPIEKAINPNGDVLLAYQMNDQVLPPEHGYPLRLIVPGHAGIRNLKSITKIIVKKHPSDGMWQQGIAYKGLPHFVTSISDYPLETVYSTQEFPVQSAIIPLTPQEGTAPQKLRGYAISGGGRGILRVEISEDNGKTWQEATLTEGKDQNPHKAWAWTFWEYSLSQPPRSDQIFASRAIDVSYNSQPERCDLCWNVRGINNNCWSRYRCT